MADRRNRRFGWRLTACVALSCLLSPSGSAAADPAEITFIGYRSSPSGGGVLFVELSEPVKVEMKRAGQVVEYELVGARVPLRNNQRPLLMRDFNSSAVTAELVSKPRAKGRAGKPAPAGVRLVITLRGNVTPSHQIVARGKGAALEVELPAPSK